MVTGVILCGGRAMRMALHFGKGFNKHLLSLGPETIIERLLRQLTAADIDQKVVILPPQSIEIAGRDLLSNYLQGCRKVYGTLSKAGDLVLGLKAAYRRNADVLVVMGDCVYLQNELISFVKCGYPSDLVGVLAGSVREHPHSSGVYILGNVDGYTRTRDPAGIVSAGIYLMRPWATEYICEAWNGVEASMCKLMDDCVSNGLKTRVFMFSSSYDINTPEAYFACLEDPHMHQL